MLLASPQEPAPIEPPAPTQEPEQNPEQEQGQEPVSLEQVTEAMNQVSNRMAEISSSLRDVSAQADNSGELPPAASLNGALENSRLLLEEMENLLALIPEPPPPPPNSGNQGNDQGEQQQQNRNPDPGNIPQGNEPSEGDEESESQESTDGTSERPPESPMSTLLQTPRNGQWGNLPPRLQRTIDAASANDVPLRYRRWLIEYHRRAGE